MRLNTVKATVTNLCSNVCCDLSYVVEGAAWSIREDGRQIVEQMYTSGLGPRAFQLGLTNSGGS